MCLKSFCTHHGVSQMAKALLQGFALLLGRHAVSAHPLVVFFPCSVKSVVHHLYSGKAIAAMEAVIQRPCIVNHMDTDPLADKSTSQDKSYIGTIPLHEDLHQEAVSALENQVLGKRHVPVTYSVSQIQHFVGAD